MPDDDPVNIGSSNNILLDGTSPLPTPMITYRQEAQLHSFDSYSSISQDIHTSAINHKHNRTFTILMFQWNPPGTHEFKAWEYEKMH